MLDKIYQVVDTRFVGNERVSVINNNGCFVTIEEAQKFVREFFLKDLDTEFEPIEDSDGRVWEICDYTVAIITVPVGFDNVVKTFNDYTIYPNDI